VRRYAADCGRRTSQSDRQRLRHGRRRRDASDEDTTEGDVTRIGFVGDLMLGRSVNERWVDDDNPENVWGSTLSRLQELDGLVGNLECCVSDRGTRWPNKGTTSERLPPSRCRPSKPQVPRSSRSRTITFSTTASPRCATPPRT